MSGKFYGRTSPEPSVEWLALPEVREARRYVPRAAWSTRILWFAIGVIAALIVRGV